MVNRFQDVATVNWEYQISFKLSFDLHVFTFSPGSEMWLSYGVFGVEDSALFMLEVNNSNLLRTTDLTLTEREIFLLDKPGSQCKHYVRQSHENSLEWSRNHSFIGAFT